MCLNEINMKCMTLYMDSKINIIIDKKTKGNSIKWHIINHYESL